MPYRRRRMRWLPKREDQQTTPTSETNHSIGVFVRLASRRAEADSKIGCIEPKMARRR